MNDGSVTDAPYRIAFQTSQTPGHLALVCAASGVHWELRDSVWTAHTTDEEGKLLTDLQDTLIQQAAARRSSR